MKAVRTITKVGLILIAIGLAGSLLTLLVASPPITQTEELAVAAPGVKRVEIIASNAGINIVPGQAPDVHVKLSGWRLNHHLEVAEDSNTLTIRVVSPRLISVLSGAPTLSVTLPDRDYESLMVDLDNGQVTVSQVSAGEVQVYTGNGRIRLDDIQAGQVELQVNNGDITVNDPTGGVIAKTDNGRIVLSTPDLDRPIELSADNGNITVKTGQVPSTATLDLSTRNGWITVFGDRTSSHWHQTFGERGHLVRVTTHNGNIVISQ